MWGRRWKTASRFWTGTPNPPRRTRERKDLFLGTVVSEDTQIRTGRAQITNEVWDMKGEHRTTDFKDLLGQRSDVDSRDLNVDVRFKPKKSLAFSAVYE